MHDQSRHLRIAPVRWAFIAIGRSAGSRITCSRQLAFGL